VTSRQRDRRVTAVARDLASRTALSTVRNRPRNAVETADWTNYRGLDFAQKTGWDEFEDLLAS
jgi:hypothetical protein